jgi:hypothetical protein
LRIQEKANTVLEFMSNAPPNAKGFSIGDQLLSRD